MPSAVSDPLYYLLLDAFPPRRDYGAAAFGREPMPPPVAHFLEHWLSHRLRHEVARLSWPRSEWFDHDHEAVQRAREAHIDTLVEQGHFPPKAWDASLREAVHQVTSYFVRPVTTLSAFVFQEGDPSVSLEMMDWRLGYFKGYGYFQEAMRLYAKQRQLQEIDRARFTDLLRKVDQKITNAYDTEAWLRLLAPLFDLVRRAQIDHGVPIALLQAFFKEKEAGVITERLHTLQHQRGIEALDEATFRQHLEAFEKPAPVPAPPPVQPAPAPRPTAEPEQASGPIPRWKQFQQTQANPRPVSPAPRPFVRTPDEKPPAPASRDARPLWMQFRSDGGDTGVPPAPVPAPAPIDLAAVERAVLGTGGARDRDVFVNNLFARSIDAYERVLRRIHNTNSWSEASKIIAEDVFRQHQVNIYSDPAILFTDAVEAQYMKRPA